MTSSLPVPLILGMPFLSSQHIIIDTESWTAKDKNMGYDLLNPTIPLRSWAPKRTISAPTPPKKARPPIKDLATASESALVG